jgi:hypothetical protein
MTATDDLTAELTRHAAASQGILTDFTDQMRDLVDTVTTQRDQAIVERDQAKADLAQYIKDHPDDPPPPPPATKTLFSAYAGPLTTGEAGQTSTTRARVAKVLGVPVLPADRVYSADQFGRAAQCPSPLVAVSYGQVPALAKGDATVIKNLTAELTALSRTGKRYDVSADHEVDAKIRKGTYTATQVEAAAARLQGIVDGIGSPNLRTAMCLTGWVFTLGETDKSHPVHYFDPDQVGLITLDPYYVTQKTIGAAFDPAWAWASQQDKPVAIWETGWGTESNPQNPTDAQALAKVNAIIDYWRTRNVEYVLWFESVKGNNLLESHPPALAAYAAAVHDSLA